MAFRLVNDRKFLKNTFRSKPVFREIGEGRNRKLCVSGSAFEFKCEMEYVTSYRVRQNITRKVINLENRRAKMAEGHENDASLM